MAKKNGSRKKFFSADATCGIEMNHGNGPILPLAMAWKHWWRGPFGVIGGALLRSANRFGL